MILLHFMIKVFLNDNIINFYLSHLENITQTSSLGTLCIFNTFFYSKLVKNGYNLIKKWIKNNVFEYDKILVPIHLTAHWSLIVIRPALKKLSIMILSTMKVLLS